MNKYTPSMKQVRLAYVNRRGVEQATLEFDRWLANHDAEAIRRYRIDEHRRIAASHDGAWREWGDSNDITTRDWHLEQAALLEKEGTE